jgi:Flp pilus assembly protein TadB
MTMTISDIANSSERSGQRAVHGPALSFFAAILAVAVTAGIAVRALHWDFVLPLVSSALFVFAAAVAVFGWRQRQTRQASLTYWDAAGALTLIGIFASAMIEPEQMLRILATERTP